MDGLGPALFGLFVVSFTVSKPVRTLHFFILISQPHCSLIITLWVITAFASIFCFY